MLESITKILHVLKEEKTMEGSTQIRQLLDAYTTLVKIAGINLSSGLKTLQDPTSTLQDPSPTRSPELSKSLKDLESLLWNQPLSICTPTRVNKQYLTRNCMYMHDTDEVYCVAEMDGGRVALAGQQGIVEVIDIETRDRIIEKRISKIPSCSSQY